MSLIFQVKLDRNSSIREEVEHRKSSRYNKLTDGRSDKLIDGKSLITDFVGATGKIVTIFTLLLSAGCMIAMLLVGHFFVYYVVVCIYEIIIICHYGYPLIKFLVCDKNNVEAVDADSCGSILYKYWLEWQIGFCFSFSVITSILLFTYLGQTTATEQTTKYAVEGLSYLLGAFSIPLPLICLRMYPNEKSQQNNITHVAKRWSITSMTYSSSKTNKTLLQKHKFRPWREEGIVFCTVIVYMIHVICFILYPILNAEFTRSINAIYYRHVPEAVYLINQLFLRGFVGILLIKTVFSLMLVLGDPQYSFCEKKWERFTKIFFYKNQVCTMRSKASIMAFFAIIFIILDATQLVTRKEIEISSARINIQFAGDDYLCGITNIFWILMHVLGILICLFATMNFHAIKAKPVHMEQSKFVQSFSVRKVSFILECVILIALYLLDTAFVYQYKKQMYNVYRQISILTLAPFEASSVFYLISIQDCCKESFAKKNWRARKLIPLYFQFVIILNMYDFVYLSIFKMTYYHQYKLDHERTRLSYSFSFAALRLLILFVTSLFKLYGKYEWAQNRYKPKMTITNPRLIEANLEKHNVLSEQAPKLQRPESGQSSASTSRSTKERAATMPTSSDDIKVEPVKKDVYAVKQWLTKDVGAAFGQYFDLFIENGYESLQNIKAIQNKAHLDEIGIKLKGHQTKLLWEINKLNLKQ